jgi:hypothetical protein
MDALFGYSPLQLYERICNLEKQVELLKNRISILERINNVE